ncbi:Ig-like domain-containing protein [Solirubrobacter phytolaccae]|uniref:Ig-like domain-containing protein n=1 Tax=Solirubrobacter phytolaccae TaxID=1404360 RepID=A0A9X3NAG3_9ACTN|nr:Ig-like domain-containing protein [Solirubrobacter phytolaccae]MDA0181449.1 Ig-like domain-containing protein [Solirubrobacter phytolaccae]
MRRAVVAFACVVLAMAVAAPAHAANGQLVAVAGGKLVAVNPDGTGLRTLWAPTGEITGLSFSPDGNQVAFSYAGKIAFYDLRNGDVTSLTAPVGAQDINPTWAPGGDAIGFRRITGVTHQRMRVTLDAREAVLGTFATAPVEFAYASSLDRWAYTLLDVLLVSTNPLEVEAGVSGAPAWSADSSKLAYIQGGRLRVAMSPGLAQSTRFYVTRTAAAAPRFSPDGTALVYVADGQARTVSAVEDATSTAIPGLLGVSAIDWQPCGVATVTCRSSVPPTCVTNSVQVFTQTDQPVQLPPAPCSDPNALPLSFVLVKGPDSGTLAGTVYTPNAGFVGQDAVTYKVSNGASASEVIKVSIFVVRRPAGTGPPAAVTPPTVAAPPFLSLRVKPRLDRKRKTTARLVCDQACTFTVRLEGTVRVKKKTKTIKGKALTRSLTPDQLLALKLKLPAKPAGKVRSIWITGTVRGANGTSRPVKLPVTAAR